MPERETTCPCCGQDDDHCQCSSDVYPHHERSSVTLWRCPDYHVKDVAALFENGSGICLTCGKGLVQRTYTETSPGEVVTKKAKIKHRINSILAEALSGGPSKYHTERGYVRWGLVESDLCEAYLPAGPEVE